MFLRALNKTANYLLVTITFFSCQGKYTNNSQLTETQMNEKAVELAHKFLILDSHIDLPYRLESDPEDISQRTVRGHFDYPRAKQGGLDAAFIIVYVPAFYEKSGGGKNYADYLIDKIDSITKKHPDKFNFAGRLEDVQQNFIDGKISFAMGMENGTPLEGKLSNLEYFYKRGIRYITLAHSNSNHISDSSYDEERKWNGLSPFGIAVVKEMNRLGMMVDVSHLSDSAFYDVIRISQVPVIASHSSCRNFTPGWERNMSDEMIKLLADHGGVIMINFGSSFLDGEVRKKSDVAWDSVSAILKEKKLSFGSPEAKSVVDDYFGKNHPGKIPVSKVAEHIDHVVKLAGINHVGLGSDFDGVYFVPEGLEDVSGYPNLIFELIKRGYSEEDIEKICSGNFLRVWKQVEDFAEQKLNQK